MTQPGWGTAPPAEERPRRTPVADIFEETFRIYRGNFPLMAGIYAVFQIPIILASVPFEPWQLRWTSRFGSPFEVSPGSLSSADVLSEYAALLVNGLALAVVGLILGTFGGAAITYIVGRVRNGDRPTVREVFLALRRLAGPVFMYIALLVVGFILGAICLSLVLGIVLAVLAVALGRGGEGLYVLLTLATIVIIVVAAVAASTRLALAVQALVLERSRAVDAFRRSWNLVRGATWRTFGILLLAGLVIGVLGAIASPVFLPGVMQGVVTGSPGPYLLVALAAGIAQIVLGPLIPTLLTVLYFDYAARRE